MPESSGIARYCKDGYKSYGIHVKDSDSEVYTDVAPGIRVGYGIGYNPTYNIDNYRILKQYKKAKLAYCNRNGDVILVTNVFRIKTSVPVFADIMDIRAQNQAVKVKYYVNYFMLCIAVIVIILLVVIGLIIKTVRKSKKKNISVS